MTDKIDTKLNDEGISQMMDWLLPSSANTLEYVNLTGVNVTRTPIQFAYFQNLRSISLTENVGNMTVKADTFFSNRIEYIDLDSVGFVEEGAFQGKLKLYSYYWIFENNYLSHIHR